MIPDFTKFGIAMPEVLLPNPRVDLANWSVIACDQFTSEPDYWEQVSRIVGQAPSTLKMIFPEIYLERGDAAERITTIQNTMREYLDQGILMPQPPGFIYLERRTGSGVRRGLMVALDLEYYDYRPGSQSFIRATEGTVLERIPPRVRIRSGALLELPHIMVLIDDPGRGVIEPLGMNRDRMKRIYHTELMMDGGEISGYRIDTPELLAGIWNGLAELGAPDSLERKYGPEGQYPFLFAVGDGNHSLATAKTVWEELKRSRPQVSNIPGYPARYALVELVNLHDPALQFEPIHRVIFGVNPEEFWDAMQHYYESLGAIVTREEFNDPETASIRIQSESSTKGQSIVYSSGLNSGIIHIISAPHLLEAGTLQMFLDHYKMQNPGVSIDYIHGSSVVKQLTAESGNIGFYLPPFDKNTLFPAVISAGVLPRKTFSMGEAVEKRYYMECRRIL
ncbi:MAG TPA: DUF1015 domain-containing protein [Bacillota bacterium]